MCVKSCVLLPSDAVGVHTSSVSRPGYSKQVSHVVLLSGADLSVLEVVLIVG
jgi:hypothetical protein